MNPNRPNPEPYRFYVILLATLLSLGFKCAQAEQIILHLHNGDRIAGNLISEDTNRVVLATTWIKELSVPLSAIKQREAVPPPASLPPAIVERKPPATNVVAVAKSPPPSPPVKPASSKLWKANLTLGTDLQFGQLDRQLYYSRLKLTYERPYKHTPQKFFRSIFDYAVDYGQTDGVRSANRMEGSMKMDFDVGKRWFIYNLGGAGYDEIRKIDLHYEDGPGIGYHLFQLPKFVANVEAGGNYQVQERQGSPDVRNFFLRFAEDVTWKIGPKLTFTEKFEFTPQAEDLSRYRFRFDSNLSFPLWKNISLNLSVLDLYDTNPPGSVSQNELLIRSALGITF